MSALSTIKVTRSKAREVIISQVLSSSDDKLRELMDVFLYSMLYNCWIVEDSDEDNEDYLI